MLSLILYVVLGAVAGHLLAVVARKAPDRELRLYGEALAVASFVYVAFAMASMESVWLAVEIAGLLIFVGFAYVGLTRSVTWLWTGWALHILWDAGVHLGFEAAFVPEWYPVACIGFDAVVVYHVYQIKQVARDAAPATASIT